MLKHSKPALRVPVGKSQSWCKGKTVKEPGSGANNGEMVWSLEVTIRLVISFYYLSILFKPWEDLTLYNQNNKKSHKPIKMT